MFQVAYENNKRRQHKDIRCYYITASERNVTLTGEAEELNVMISKFLCNGSS